MTEAEWLDCDQAQAMLDSLPENMSGRKLRLFACSCCRRLWNRFLDERSKRAILMAEMYAEGLARFDELQTAAGMARQAEIHQQQGTFLYAAQAASFAADNSPQFAATQSAESILDAILCMSDDAEAEQFLQASFLHDIFGNPFRPVAVNPAWQTANVVALAQAIYDERAFDRMPILGDALEDAGCTNADMLMHCRQPGEHVRGCWAVDLLLGKQ